MIRSLGHRTSSGTRTSLIIKLVLAKLFNSSEKYGSLHMNHRSIDLDAISWGYAVCYSSIFLIKAVPSLPEVK